MKEPPFQDWDNPNAEDYDLDQPRQPQKNNPSAGRAGERSGNKDSRQPSGGVADRSFVSGSFDARRDASNYANNFNYHNGSMQQGTAALLRSLPREPQIGQSFHDTSQSSLDATWQRISGVSSSLALRDDLSHLRVSAIQLPSLTIRSTAASERDPEVVRLLEEQAREMRRQKDQQELLQQQLQLQAQGQQAQLMQLLLVQQHQLQQQMTSMASMQAASGIMHPGSFPSPSSYSATPLNMMHMGAMPSPQGPGGIASPGAFMTPQVHVSAGTRDMPRYPQQPMGSGPAPPEQRQLYADMNAAGSYQGAEAGMIPGSLAFPPTHPPAGTRDMPHPKFPPSSGPSGDPPPQVAVSTRDVSGANLPGSLSSPPISHPVGTRDMASPRVATGAAHKDVGAGYQQSPMVQDSEDGHLSHLLISAVQGEGHGGGGSTVVKLGAAPARDGDASRPGQGALSVAIPEEQGSERLSLLAAEASSQVAFWGDASGKSASVTNDKEGEEGLLSDASFSHLRDVLFAILFLLNLCMFVVVGIAAFDAQEFYASRRLMRHHHHHHHHLRRHYHRHLLGVGPLVNPQGAVLYDYHDENFTMTGAADHHLDSERNQGWLMGMDLDKLMPVVGDDLNSPGTWDTWQQHGGFPLDPLDPLDPFDPGTGTRGSLARTMTTTTTRRRRSLLGLVEPGWYEELAPMLLASATIGISLGFLWLALVRWLPRFCLRASLILPPFVFTIATVALIASRRWAEGVISALCAAVVILYFVTVRRYVGFSCELLASGTAALSAFPSVTAFAYWATVLQLLWLTLVAVVACVVADAWGYWPLIYVAITYFWVSEVIKNVLHVGAAGVVGMWYFGRTPQAAGGHVVKVAFRRACRPLFGCACFGSLLVPLIATLRGLTVFARALVDRHGHTCVRVLCFPLTCAVGTIELIIAWCNKYGLSRAALAGTSFVPSSRAAWRVVTDDKGFGRAGGQGVALENANLVDAVIQLAALVTGMLAAMGGALWANELFEGRDKLGEKSVSTFIGCFLVTYTLVETWLQLISAACNGLLISLLTSPAHLASHGDKAVGGLLTAWKDLFGVALGGDAALQAVVPAVTSPPAAQTMANDGVVRKRAVLFGLNYRGQNGELNGCINDVAVQKQMLLTKYGFPESCIRVLTDDTPEKPTLDNIRKNLEWLRSVPGEGWTLFLHYSGHGTQVPDEDGDEEDGMDEALVPLDFEATGKALTDDELRKSLFDQIPHGARLYAFFDCCHSGTMSDLKEVAAKQVAAAAHAAEDKAGGRFLPPSEAAKQRIEELAALRKKQHAEQGEENKPGSKLKIPKLQKVVVLSGCRDDQTAADAFINGKYAGATTWALQQVLEASASVGMPHISLISLINGMNEKLQKGGYTQEAKLSVGDIDPTKPEEAAAGDGDGGPSTARRRGRPRRNTPAAAKPPKRRRNTAAILPLPRRIEDDSEEDELAEDGGDDEANREIIAADVLPRLLDEGDEEAEPPSNGSWVFGVGEPAPGTAPTTNPQSRRTAPATKNIPLRVTPIKLLDLLPDPKDPAAVGRWLSLFVALIEKARQNISGNNLAIGLVITSILSQFISSSESSSIRLGSGRIAAVFLLRLGGLAAAGVLRHVVKVVQQLCDTLPRDGCTVVTDRFYYTGYENAIQLSGN
eukprot:jgi/Mesvir1/28122/Mv04701-RA.1